MGRFERKIIGIFGRINAGKSTCMNLLTQQGTSLVDAQPGTTADIKSALLEIHAIGPCKVLDTAGLDEESRLGEKKRRKTLDALEEVDLAVLVIDPVQTLLAEELSVEDSVATLARKLGRPLCVVFNRRRRDVVPGLIRWFVERGIVPMGRYGTWDYLAMEDSLRHGREVARWIAGRPK